MRKLIFRAVCSKLSFRCNLFKITQLVTGGTRILIREVRRAYSLNHQLYRRLAVNVTGVLCIAVLLPSNYHKFSSLKQHKFITSQFLYVQRLGTACSLGLTGLKPECSSHLRAWVLFRAHWLLAEFISLQL